MSQTNGHHHSDLPENSIPGETEKIGAANTVGAGNRHANLNEPQIVPEHDENIHDSFDEFISVEPDEPLAPEDTENYNNRRASGKKWIVVGAALIFLVVGFLLFSRSFFAPENKQLNVKAGTTPQNQTPALNLDHATNALTQTPETAPNTELNSQTPAAGNIFVQSPADSVPVTQTNPAVASLNKPVSNDVYTPPNVNIKDSNGIVVNPGSGGAPANDAGGNNKIAPANNAAANGFPESAPSSQSSSFLFGGSNSVQSNAAAKNFVNSDGAAINAAAIDAPRRPPFGTILPLQTLGAVDTLRRSSLVRLILTRPIKGEGWDLPRGTIFIANVSEGIGGRAFLQIQGYLDNKRNAMVRMGGELNGADGAAGLKGERRKVGSRWMKVVRDIGEKAYQTTNSFLTGRSGGSTTRIELPPSGDVGLANRSQASVEYTYVEPGSYAYLMVTDLPKEVKTELGDLPAEGDTGNYLSDGEVVELLTNGDETAIINALPRIRPELRAAVRDVLRQQKKINQTVR